MGSNMHNFKIGDRVIGISNYTGVPIERLTGTIIDITQSGSIGIEFDSAICGGHSCSNKGKDKHCYYICSYYEKYIKKIDAMQYTSKFKVGDRVIVTSEIRNHLPKGSIGTVIQMLGVNRIRIEMDNAVNKYCRTISAYSPSNRCFSMCITAISHYTNVADNSLILDGVETGRMSSTKLLKESDRKYSYADMLKLESLQLHCNKHKLFKHQKEIIGTLKQYNSSDSDMLSVVRWYNQIINNTKQKTITEDTKMFNITKVTYIDGIPATELSLEQEVHFLKSAESRITELKAIVTQTNKVAAEIDRLRQVLVEAKEIFNTN